MHREGLNMLIEQLMGGSSSSSASGASTKPTLDEFFNALCGIEEEMVGDVGEDGGLTDSDPSNPLLQILCSIGPYTMSAYCHSNGLENYNGMQQSFIQLMQGSIFSVPVESIESRLLDIEDKLSESSLPIEQKTPLFQALSIGRNDLSYWTEKLNNPGLWSPFLNSNYAVNYANLSFWVSASMEGALIYANRALPTLPPVNTAVDIIAATVSGVSLVAGKVIFGWVPKVKGVM